MPSWKHGCFLAEYLVWFIRVYSVGVNISLSPSRLLFFCVLRHIQPAVQLLLVAQLAQRLAEQLDCETGNCQFQSLRPACLRQTPSFRNSCPREFFVFHILTMFRMQGVQRLDECLKERGTQEVVKLSDS